MEKTNWFHQGVELTHDQLSILEPLLQRNFGKKFSSYEAFEEEADRLLTESGCPIDPQLRLPSSIERGLPTNSYFWQIDNEQCVASGFIDAISLRDAAQQLMKSRHALLLENRKVPEDLAQQFPIVARCLQSEFSGPRWRIRITLMISGETDKHMSAAMLNHKIVAG